MQQDKMDIEPEEIEPNTEQGMGTSSLPIF